MKANAVALSFGFLVTKSSERTDGVREGIDLFEISVVPGPANPDTRFLELKSASLSDEEIWLPRESGAQQKSAGPPSGDRMEQEIEEIVRRNRPVRFETFEVG
jgi:phage head maturation protease